MMTLRRSVLALAAGIALLTTDAVLARVDVKIDFDKNFDFKSVRTWSFDPSSNGEVKMARTQEDDPDAAKAIADPILVDAVNVEMAKLKLQRADNPDIIVRYFLLLTNTMSAQTLGQFLPGTVSWGLPPFQQSTQSLEIMNQGSLVIDLAANGNVVWRGVAQAKIKFGIDAKKRESLLREAVRDLLRRFPPKK